MKGLLNTMVGLCGFSPSWSQIMNIFMTFVESMSSEFLCIEFRLILDNFNFHPPGKVQL